MEKPIQAWDLAVPVGKVLENVLYFLARDGQPRATLLGWAWRWELLERIPYCFPGRTSLNHCIPRRELRSLNELRAFMPEGTCVAVV